MLTSIVITLIKTFMTLGCIILMLGFFLYMLYCAITMNFWENVTNEGYLFSAQDHILEEGVAVSVVTILVCIYGFVTLCVNQRIMLLVFAVLMLLTATIQVGVTAAMASSEIPITKVQVGLEKMLKSYQEGSEEPVSVFADSIFTINKCCGITDFRTDFLYLNFKDNKRREKEGISENSTIPFTCCKEWKDYADSLESYRDCLESPTSENAYTAGCLKKLTDLFALLRDWAVIPMSFAATLELCIAGGAALLFLRES